RPPNNGPVALGDEPQIWMGRVPRFPTGSVGLERRVPLPDPVFIDRSDSRPVSGDEIPHGAHLEGLGDQTAARIPSPTSTPPPARPGRGLLGLLLESLSEQAADAEEQQVRRARVLHDVERDGGRYDEG